MGGPGPDRKRTIIKVVAGMHSKDAQQLTASDAFSICRLPTAFFDCYGVIE